MPKQKRLLEAVHHVVHDYANLVSSGTMAVNGKHGSTPLTPPINTHVGDAFLMNCRKMYDFFKGKERKGNWKNDIRSTDFFADGAKEPDYCLGNWKKWYKAMNKQLVHVTYTRVEQPKRWEGHHENPQFLEEFKTAWKSFLGALPELFSLRFDEEIAKKEGSEFKGLDLR